MAGKDPGFRNSDAAWVPSQNDRINGTALPPARLDRSCMDDTECHGVNRDFPKILVTRNPENMKALSPRPLPLVLNVILVDLQPVLAKGD
jgi:hypothetical protein